MNYNDRVVVDSILQDMENGWYILFFRKNPITLIFYDYSVKDFQQAVYYGEYGLFEVGNKTVCEKDILELLKNNDFSYITVWSFDDIIDTVNKYEQEINQKPDNKKGKNNMEDKQKKDIQTKANESEKLNNENIKNKDESEVIIDSTSINHKINKHLIENDEKVKKVLKEMIKRYNSIISKQIEAGNFKIEDDCYVFIVYIKSLMGNSSLLDNNENQKKYILDIFIEKLKKDIIEVKIENTWVGESLVIKYPKILN